MDLKETISTKTRFDLIHDELISLRRHINRMAEDEKTPLNESARSLVEIHLDEAMIAVRKATLAMVMHGPWGRKK